MTATDELSRMLDERGKDHRIWPSGRVIWHDEGSWVYEYNPPKGDDDYWGGILHATLRHCTPEQAIDATLGRGTCRRVLYKPTGVLVCSECGAGIPKQLDKYCYLHYCPNCGRKVVDA